MSEIAVVIPTYNRAASLKRAIHSVQAQRFREFEIVVVDDGSQDEIAPIVPSCGNCRYLRLAHTGLPAIARNAGAHATDSRYIAFLDSDDVWLPHKLESQMKIMAGSAYGVVCSNALAGNGRYFSVGQEHSGNVRKDLLQDNFVITSTAVIRRDVFDRIGGFDESSDVHFEDYDLWLRAAAVAPFFYIDEALIVYRRSVSGFGSRFSKLEHWQRMEQFLTRTRRTFDGDPNGLEAVVVRQLDSYRRSICDEYLELHRYRDFARNMAGFAARRPLHAAKYLAAKVLR
jgi:glycosyltransferase involved in cell wall biosynthesis